MEKVLGAYILKENIVFVVIEKNIEVFIAANTVMVAAFWAHEEVLPQFRYRTYIITAWTFGP